MAAPSFKAESKTRQCVVSDCDRGARSKGYCGKHYQRMHYYGTVKPRERAKLPQGACFIRDCGKPSRSPQGKTCETHYYRFRRTGTYDAPVYGSWAINQSGYVVRRDRKHPATSAAGYLYQHRAVLYDSIGGGTHECAWCKREVDWASKDAAMLVVDHLDGDKANNAEGNLLPSCQRCNSTRGLFQAWIAKHRDDPFLRKLFEEAQA